MAERHRLRTIFESLSFRVEEAARRPSPEQAAVAQAALVEVRVGLERRNSAVLELVHRLSRALGDALAFEKIAENEPIRQLQIDELLRRLEAELSRGRVVVEREQDPRPKERPDSVAPKLPSLPPRPRERAETFFEVRWIDETAFDTRIVDTASTVPRRFPAPRTSSGGCFTTRCFRATTGSLWR
ncbi:MAG: hypothetical protein M3020_14585 [Myxococcota bacterium]|nr:hypothetical protein [Myxococcota bacterium]